MTHTPRGSGNDGVALEQGVDDILEWWQYRKEQSRRRVSNRELAMKILSRGFLFQVPPEKYKKLLKASGAIEKFYVKNGHKVRSMNESVEDLANDSFFGDLANQDEEKEGEYLLDSSKESVLDSSMVQEKENELSVEANEAIYVAADMASPRTPPQHDQSLSSLYYHPNVQKIVDYRAKHVEQPLLIPSQAIHQYLLFLSTDPLISRFMRYDYCNRVSDKYLLAVVCIYFVRSGLPEFTQEAFFKFLYLANETHEDDEESRKSIIKSVMPDEPDQMHAYLAERQFLEDRLEYWKRLNCETFVLRETLEQLFNVDPENPIWSRERAQIHAGATRRFIYEPEEVEDAVKGCYDTPIYCECCVKKLPPAALPTRLRSAARRFRLPFKKRYAPYERTPAGNAEY